MADVHLYQWVAAFVAAIWWTNRWLLTRPNSRWRHIVAGIVATVLWIPVAYTAGNVHTTSGGVTTAFGAESLGSVSIFMVVVCIAGLLVGLVLWVEEAADDASAQLPASMRHGERGD